MTFASLPMYDFPEIRWATDRWWQAIADGAGLDDAPPGLEREVWREVHWRDRNLAFSQTCGYPLIETFHPYLTVLGAPRYAVDGCTGHDYSSVFCARAEDASKEFADFAGRRLTTNGRDSQSGYNVIKAEIGRLGLDPGDGSTFFSEMSISGNHRASLALLKSNDADFAALDAVSYDLARRHAPEEVEGIAIIGYSVSGPALPYVTGQDRSAADVAGLRRAIQAAVADPALEDVRAAIGLAGFDEVDADEYERIAAITAMGRDVVLAPEDRAA